MGLTGQVREVDFHAVRKGFHPLTGDAMAQNAGDKDRIALYDCTFSSPKSVSNAWAIGDTQTRAVIDDAWEKSIDRTLDEMQQRFVQSRRGHDGLDVEKVALVAARWNHGTSRDGDEDKHTHVTIMNVCTRADGTTASIDGQQFFEYQKVCGAIQRLHLEQGLRERGFATERDGESFRLLCVPKSLERAASTGRQRILAEMAERGTSGAKAAEIANLATRSTKDHAATPEVLREGWIKRAAEYGFTAGDARPGKEPVLPTLEKIAAAEVLREATEHKAVLKEKEIEFAALISMMGTGQGREAAGDLHKEARGEAVALTNGKGAVRYTSTEILQKEAGVIQMLKDGKTDQQHVLDPQAVAAAIAKIERSRGIALSAEQRAAVEHMTTRPGRDSVLVGDAGTGKTTALEAAKLAYEAAGYRVIGTATDGKKAADLEKDLGLESHTIDKLTGDIKRGRDALAATTVILVDEAGRVDARRWHRLKAAAEERGAKVVWCGDHKQLQAVGAGSPFRHAAEAAGGASLTEIHRQRDGDERAAVQQISRGESAKAMLGYIERGQVSVVGTHRQACRKVAEKYVQAAVNEGKEQTLALALTNKRVEDMNAAIRTEFKKRGELAGGREFDAVREKGQDRKTGEIKTEMARAEYAPGDRVLHAGHNDYAADLRRGDFGTVTKVEERGVTVKLDRGGREVLIDPGKQDLRHGFAATVDRSQGATVERPIVLLSADISREYAYVAASRGREATEFVTTKNAIKQIAENTPPTDKMREYAERLEAQRVERGEKPSLPENYKESVHSTREYLDKHAASSAERGPWCEAENGPVNDPMLKEFRAVVEAMSVSRQAESTLDWTVKHPTKEQQHEQDRDRDFEKSRSADPAEEHFGRARHEPPAESLDAVRGLSLGPVAGGAERSEGLLQDHAHLRLDHERGDPDNTLRWGVDREAVSPAMDERARNERESAREIANEHEHG